MTRSFLTTGIMVALLAMMAACKTAGSDAVSDTTAPTVHISGPGASTPAYVGEMFEVRGTSEDEVGVTRVTVAVAGAASFDATLNADGSWSAEITPETVGPLDISAVAHDAAGNASEPSEIQYQTHLRGDSYHVDTLNFAVGSDSGMVRVYKAVDGVADWTDVPVGATVTVNGTVLPLVGATEQSFQGSLVTGPLGAGDAMELSVVVDSTEIATQWTMPATPTQTGPDDGTNFDIGDPISLIWESAEDPDYFQILLLPDAGSSSWSERIPGEARSFELDLSRLPTDGSAIRSQVVAFNEVKVSAFTGPAAAGSTATGENRANLTLAPVFSIGSP